MCHQIRACSTLHRSLVVSFWGQRDVVSGVFVRVWIVGVDLLERSTYIIMLELLTLHKTVVSNGW